MTAAATSSARPAVLRWQGAASCVCFVLLWHYGATLSGSRLFPPPLRVGEMLWQEAIHGPLLFHLGITLCRVAAGLVLALIVGSALGYAVGRSPAADRWLKPWITVFLNIPALVMIILIYVWFGLTEAALIAAVSANKIPNVAVTVQEGAARLDRELADMAQVYRLGWRTRLRHVILPQLAPYLLVATRNGLALTWKIVLVAELLGRSNGIGFQLQVFFQNFDVARILAYTLAFTAVVLAFEYGILGRLERRLAAWRP